MQDLKNLSHNMARFLLRMSALSIETSPVAICLPSKFLFTLIPICQKEGLSALGSCHADYLIIYNRCNCKYIR